MTPYKLRVGARIGSNDPFWVQAREAVYRRAQQCAIDLVPIDIGHSSALAGETQLGPIEELLAQDLDALICAYLPENLLCQVLGHDIPVIHLTETSVRHPLLVSAEGYYEIAQTIGRFVVERLGGNGHVLVVGGLLAKGGEDGRSRIAGLHSVLCEHPRLHVTHIPSAWRYAHAYPQIETALHQHTGPIDAIIGLSDSLALAARDAGRALGLLGSHTLIVGINGDPLALAAIADGSMTATVDTPAADFGIQAVDIACAAAMHGVVAPHIGYLPRLVTSTNVSDVAMQKLIAMAELPDRLVGVNREQEQQRLAQLETSLAISHRIASILDEEQLTQEIVELIRSNYGYDAARLMLWDERQEALSGSTPSGTRILLEQAGVLAFALQRNEPVFVPDMRHSQRFPADEAWPHTRSRVVVPIRQGDRIVGLLDLHSFRAMHHTRQSLAGLQVLADQLGIAMRNAELYREALQAQAQAEKADQLKTRLLANVSHELRAPLNVIMGYSQAALVEPNPYTSELPGELLRDVQHIYRSSQHLMRLINDLLDLSRAEIDELELFPESIDTGAFIAEVFHSIAERSADSAVEFRLSLPEQLPLIQADQLRLRQVLLNLLVNARKFTARGHITLGADIAAPYLHIWVEDTGVGIPPALQEQIFEPFVTGHKPGARPQGVGLGLSITRRLVALHRGTIRVESRPGVGSTFHIELPLPNLQGDSAAPADVPGSTLLLISAGEEPTPAIAELCLRRGLALRRIGFDDDLDALLSGAQVAALAWDMGAAEPSDWRLVERLRNHSRARGVPFLLYGAHADAPGGNIGLLSKPLLGPSLIATIESLRLPGAAAPVLIVDDDPHIREMYEQMIRQALPELPIRSAADGTHALAAIAEELPSLVVLDLVMPHTDGFVVLERLRQNERTRRVPVIIISGQTLAAEDIKRLDYGQVTFHSKGILSAEETTAVLRDTLRGDRLAPQTSLVVKQAIAYIQRHCASDLSRQQIAAAVGVSENYLTRIFSQELGISPWEYLTRFRIKQAKLLLQTTRDSIAGVAGQVGFADSSYFGRVFRRHVGCTPQSYRDQFS